MSRVSAMGGKRTFGHSSHRTFDSFVDFALNRGRPPVTSGRQASRSALPISHFLGANRTGISDVDQEVGFLDGLLKP